MTETLLLSALKETIRGIDCIETNPFWWNTAQCSQFIESGKCDSLSWAIQTVNQNSESLGCFVKKLTGEIRILVFDKPGIGQTRANIAGDCIVCYLENNPSSRVEDGNLALTLYYVQKKRGPFVRRRDFDQFGRAVTEISAPYTAQTCKCR